MKKQTADLIKNGDSSLSNEFFVSPEPSLCDSCRNAYFVEGGYVWVGGKEYRQRYCMSCKIDIHANGTDDCLFHNPIGD